MMVSIANNWSIIFLAALLSHVVVGTGPEVSFVPSLIRANNRHASRKKNVSLCSILGSIGSDFAKDVARAVQPSVALVTPIGVRNMTDRGSGFVVEFDGTDEYVYLLTSAHVVIPGKRIEVTFPAVLLADPATTFDATVIDRDVAIDLALIRIQRSANASPPALQLYDGDVAEVGTLAFAHGYPGGVSGAAMTSGIVCATTKGLGLSSVRSARGRTVWQDPFLQANNETVFVVTDAAMAGGMSGGPLVSVDGTVLGVNALVRPDLRALGNYAVSASECRSFLTRVAATQLRMATSTKTSTDSGVTGNGEAQNIGYRVVLYNDPMNTRARVAKVLNDIADLNADDANQVMMDAHTTGSGIVREFILGDDCAKFAQDLCESLRRQDVLAEVERL
eukprot:scaffold33693_cov49-Attheya_sp.AAC.4